MKRRIDGGNRMAMSSKRVSEESLPNLDELSEEEIVKLLPDELKKKVSLARPELFSYRYFQRRGLVEKKIPDFHSEWYRLAENNDRLCILAPRDHAKSSVFSVMYPIWKLCRNRNIRIQIISVTRTQAKKYMTQIKTELEINRKLIEDFGDFRDNASEWQSDSITIDRSMNIKDPTITVAGLGSSKLGNRADLIICDDVIDRDACYTEHRRNKASRWFNEVLTNYLEEDGGKIVVIGTKQHNADLYTELEDNPEYVVKRYKSIENADWQNEERYEDTEVLWEDKWDWDCLIKRKREIGSVAFSRQYQNEVVSVGSSMFPPNLLDTIKSKEGNLVNEFGERPKWLRNYRLFMGCDLASSAQVGADYCVFLTLGIDEKENRHLLNMWRKKGVDYTKQVNKIRELHDFFDHEKVVVESNAYQKVLPETLKDESAVPVMEHQTGTEKHSEEEGVPRLRTLFENGKYEIPYSESSREKTKVLINELMNIGWDEGKVVTTGRHNDAVMALWLAELGIRSTPLENRFSIIRRG